MLSLRSNRRLSLRYSLLKEQALNPVNVLSRRWKTVQIGDVVVNKEPGTNPSLVPARQFDQLPQELVQHLRWIAQKYNLKQDMFLTGHPGPVRRRLILSFANICGIEVEYLPISRDSTESDIKQRKEIKGNSVIFYDQAPVRAAIHGRLLIIDGIENAERNVLPTLNNLLENREMALEDGRFLCNNANAAHLTADNLISTNASRLVQVHPDFRVVALGQSTPPYKGRNLDPPLRSRLQGRFVDEVSTDTLLDLYKDKVALVDPGKLQQLVGFYESLRAIRNTLVSEGVTGSDVMSGVPVFSADSFSHCLSLLAKFSELKVEEAVFRCIPLQAGVLPTDVIPHRVRPMVNSLLKTLVGGVKANNSSGGTAAVSSAASSAVVIAPVSQYKLSGIQPDAADPSKVQISFSSQSSRSGGLFSGLFSKEDLTVTASSGGVFSTAHHQQVQRQTAKKAVSEVLLDSQKAALSGMMMDHSLGRHVCILGPKGSGKSHMARVFASLLGYRVRAFPLYAELTPRDLLQRRVTVSSNSTGATDNSSDSSSSSSSGWVDSPLIAAARAGDICILDGVDRLDPHSLHSLRSLLQEGGFIDLPNGERLSSSDGSIPASFRVVAVGLTGNTGASAQARLEEARVRWVSGDWGFAYHYLPPTSTDAIVQLINAQHQMQQQQQQQQNGAASAGASAPNADLVRLISNIAMALNDNKAVAALTSELQLSLRQMLRLYRLSNTAKGHTSGGWMSKLASSLSGVDTAQVINNLRNMLMLQFMSPTVIGAFNSAIKPVLGGTMPSAAVKTGIQTSHMRAQVLKGVLTIGDVQMPIKPTGQHPEKIPSPLFYDNPTHTVMLRELLQALCAGEKALLLLGNQGVGKNKLVDRLLQMLNAEREYIQLHRDTTVQGLLLLPLLENGKIVYQDSPLLLAARTGRIAVLDEADKAPLEVVCLLKSLIEDGELVLSDGRRLLSHARLTAEGSDPLNPPSDCIPIHPDFVLFVLANRPGFPFLGNDFFRECGDIFSVHIVDNLDLQSECELLQAYGPNVDKDVVMKIATAFAELRNMHSADNLLDKTLEKPKKGSKSVNQQQQQMQKQQQVLLYPFSAREAVSVVKHLSAYPQDGVTSAVENIVAFDTLSPQLRSQVVSVFHKVGLPISQQYALKNGDGTEWKITELLPDGSHRETEKTGRPRTGLDKPKHGKEDEKNEPHVGGNTWAGGTGGSDTAGLGGRGGPYRLDKGHTIHQVSDEMKAQVSEESRRQARAMAEEALKERLKEISMGQRDYSMYLQYKTRVENQIHQMRSILEEMAHRKKERVWLRHQTHGDLDDSKLVDGLSGDRLVFKRRGTSPSGASTALDGAGDDSGANKKLFHFVVDVSGSMYRFNQRDQRLERMLEAVLLVMEVFPSKGAALPEGVKYRTSNSLSRKQNSTQEEPLSDDYTEATNDLNIDYCVTGHSGSREDVTFIDFHHQKPQNEAERFSILEYMVAHTQYCDSGDNTLEAVSYAVGAIEREAQRVSGHEGVDANQISKFVLAVSDANFDRYGISPHELAAQMNQARSKGILVHFILIASLGDEAERISRLLPAGQVHICHESTDLPAVFRTILTSGAFDI